MASGIMAIQTHLIRVHLANAFEVMVRKSSRGRSLNYFANVQSLVNLTETVNSLSMSKYNRSLALLLVLSPVLT
jgi:hypothetical protein